MIIWRNCQWYARPLSPGISCQEGKNKAIWAEMVKYVEYVSFHVSVSANEWELLLVYEQMVIQVTGLQQKNKDRFHSHFFFLATSRYSAAILNYKEFSYGLFLYFRSDDCRGENFLMSEKVTCFDYECNKIAPSLTINRVFFFSPPC